VLEKSLRSLDYSCSEENVACVYCCCSVTGKDLDGARML
jgi:hypothetical protein